MSKVYKTHDYSHIPIQKIEDEDLCNFSQIANLTIRELCEKQNANLLIYPPQLDIYKDNLADNYIFKIDDKNLQTCDLLGFIGKNESQLTIGTRFAKDGSDDYFLHYMLQKVFKINLLDLKHSTSEEKIFDSVMELDKDKMIFLVSHRFSTVRKADKILVIENGELIESGHHEQLIKKKGRYHELFTLQAQSYQ